MTEGSRGRTLAAHAIIPSITRACDPGGRDRKRQYELDGGRLPGAALKHANFFTTECTRNGGSMHTALDDQVRSRLSSDPRIPDAATIAVSGDRYTVTLRGAVATFGQRRAAVSDARNVPGVEQVFYDGLKVHLLAEHHREDAEIRGVALQTLIWDSEVDAESVDVRVNAGWVTLTGILTYQFQSDAAYDDVARLRGVVGVTNKIRVLGA